MRGRGVRAACEAKPPGERERLLGDFVERGGA